MNAGPSTNTRLSTSAGLRRALVVPVLVVIGLLLVITLSVRVESGYWPLLPSATPSTIDFSGRVYLRGAEQDSVEEGWVRVGRTEHGGVIYGEKGSATSVPTGLDVVTRSRVVGYGLSGGP